MKRARWITIILHLGTVVGSNDNKEEFVLAEVSEWVKQLEVLTNFACTEPHAAFSGFIHGLRHRYSYFMRTIPGISRVETTKWCYRYFH